MRETIEPLAWIRNSIKVSVHKYKMQTAVWLCDVFCIDYTISYLDDKSQGSKSIKIKSIEHIGSGRCAQTYRVSIVYGGHVSSMVIKDYYGYDKDVGNVQNRPDNHYEAVDHSVEMHSFCKANNIATWTTYKKIKGKPMILMTDGRFRSSVRVLTLNDSHDNRRYSKEKITHISNIQEFVTITKDTLQQTIDSGFLLGYDSIFFFYDEETQALQLGVCDFDLCAKDQDRQRCIDENKVMMTITIRDFLRRFCDQSIRKDFMRTQVIASK